MASYDSLSGFRTLVDAYDPGNQWRNAQGLIAETFPHNIAVGPQALVSGTCYFSQIFIPGGKTLTNCHVSNSITGVSITVARIGLYDTAGTLLASCANQSSAWEAVGFKSQALSAAYTVGTSGIYYAGVVTVAATGPGLVLGLAAAASRIGATDPLSGKPIYFGSTQSLSDLPSPLTVAAGTAPGLPWIAFS